MQFRWKTRSFLLVLTGAIALLAQQPGGREPARLPDGRLQSQAILKDDYKNSLEDVTEIQKLADDLKQELKKNKTHILSISSIKKTEEIEKLAKRIRQRLKR